MKFSTIPLAVAGLVVCTGTAEAHVKMLYKAAQPYPIRNADGATADGRFSTSGACGSGGAAFASNGELEVNKDDTICLTINYNGGHKSNTQNQLRVTALCSANPGDLTQNNIENQGVLVPLITSPDIETSAITTDAQNGDYVNAPEGNDVAEGYTLCAKVPETANQLDKCTLSIMDNRPFGACVDLSIAAVQVPPPEPKPNTNTLNDVSGVYEITCDGEGTDPDDACKVCCTKGHVAVTEDGSVYVKYSTPTGNPDICPPEAFNNLASAAIAKGAIVKDELPGTFMSPETSRVPIPLPPVEGIVEQAFELKLSLVNPENPAEGKKIAFQNMDSAEPRVCDAEGAYTMTLDAAKSQGIFTEADLGGVAATTTPVTPGAGNGQQQPASGATGGPDMVMIGGIAGAAALVVGAAFVVNRRRSSGGNAPAPISAKPMTMQPSAAGSPWRATVDPNTGMTYYVNQTTGQTSWTAPVTY